ncbi:hypothetical protein CO174_03140 [Candidatus Uhrbacteria bacterium CG_4_9_14_3_um_filter_50_9]|uniref:Uncharacterized protein n=1 Tax=Candidatus Uhrbacteria bacterium CG_4_9_14_3_um_filter_50_9 TaxID=1975035 RepID=A0A2M7XC83_9BACT|nr:MAG: hypothetical protein CO174_03140 [Candidatus Uhrbacteria bacterium CG_4_9_14_3_um_filter_50_9]
MNTAIVALDLALAVSGLLIVLHSRTKDNITWWSLLAYPAYWGGGLALGHLFIVVGLRPMLRADDAGLVALLIYYLCCAFWGGLMVHLWYRLDGR